MAPPKTAEKKPAETVGVTASKGEKRPTGKAPSKSKTKASKKAAGAVGGKRRSKRKESYSSYIYKILKSVHPNIGNLQQGHPHPQLPRQGPVRQAGVRVGGPAQDQEPEHLKLP